MAMMVFAVKAGAAVGNASPATLHHQWSIITVLVSAMISVLLFRHGAHSV